MNLIATTSRSVILIDTDSRYSKIIHRCFGLYYGIALSEHGVYVASRGRQFSSGLDRASERGSLIHFNFETTEITSIYAPFSLRDLHGITLIDGNLFICCSLDEMIAIYSPDGTWSTWHPLGPPSAEGVDTSHFNTIFERERIQS